MQAPSKRLPRVSFTISLVRMPMPWLVPFLIVLLQAPMALAAEGSPVGTPVPEPSGVIALADAVAAALAGSPDLAAYGWEVRAQEARALQAALRPNPEFEAEFEDFAGSGERRAWQSAQTTLSFSQLLELGGKRAKRGQVAKLEAVLAGEDYAVRRLEVLAAVTKAFVQVLEKQERLALAGELSRLAERTVETVSATVKTGAVSSVEEDRARITLSRANLDRVGLERELGTAKANLAATWGATTVTFDRVRGELGAITPPPALDVLLTALPDSPNLARWNAEIEAREAAVSLERARRIPNLTARLGGRQYAREDDGALVAAITVPLPLFDRNQGALLEAEHRLARANAERRGVFAALHAEIVTAHQTLLAAFERGTTLHDTTIPQAQAVQTGALDAYRKGLFRYLEVLDAQRTLFELRADRLEVLAAYHSAVADLERLLGDEIRP
jgi:cobalt-zinc-cadmium efflux system outer membrane protein